MSGKPLHFVRVRPRQTLYWQRLVLQVPCCSRSCFLLQEENTEAIIHAGSSMAMKICLALACDPGMPGPLWEVPCVEAKCCSAFNACSQPAEYRHWLVVRTSVRQTKLFLMRRRSVGESGCLKLFVKTGKEELASEQQQDKRLRRGFSRVIQSIADDLYQKL